MGRGRLVRIPMREGATPASRVTVARVDVEDDSIRRFVVRHSRFDPERHEHRHVVVAAFDNEDEFLELLNSIQAGIEQRTATGALVDKNEHASGACLEPGHFRAAARGRFDAGEVV